MFLNLLMDKKSLSLSSCAAHPDESGNSRNKSGRLAVLKLVGICIFVVLVLILAVRACVRRRGSRNKSGRLAAQRVSNQACIDTAPAQSDTPR